MKLLEFSAAWCGPCREQKKPLAAFRKNHPEVDIELHDVEAEPELASRYQVEAIPCFVAVGARGALVAKAEGLMSEEEILSFWKRASRRRAARTGKRA